MATRVMLYYLRLFPLNAFKDLVEQTTNLLLGISIPRFEIRYEIADASILTNNRPILIATEAVAEGCIKVLHVGIQIIALLRLYDLVAQRDTRLKKTDS